MNTISRSGRVCKPVNRDLATPLKKLSKAPVSQRKGAIKSKKRGRPVSSAPSSDSEDSDTGVKRRRRRRAKLVIPELPDGEFSSIETSTPTPMREKSPKTSSPKPVVSQSTEKTPPSNGKKKTPPRRSILDVTDSDEEHSQAPEASGSKGRSLKAPDVEEFTEAQIEAIRTRDKGNCMTLTKGQLEYLLYTNEQKLREAHVSTFRGKKKVVYIDLKHMEYH